MSKPIKFIGTEYTVPCCGDIISSKYPGNCSSCKCGESAVDQTEYYTRFIGFNPFKCANEEEEG